MRWDDFCLIPVKMELKEWDEDYEKVSKALGSGEMLSQIKGMHRERRSLLVKEIKRMRILSRCGGSYSQSVFRILDRLSREKYLFPSDVKRIKDKMCKKLACDRNNYHIRDGIHRLGLLDGEEPLSELRWRPRYEKEYEALYKRICRAEKNGKKDLFELEILKSIVRILK